MSLKQIKNLRKQIPTFKCRSGCSDCCGPVPWSDVERAQVKNHRQQQEIDCPYIILEQGCAIYQDRPFLCRLMGAVESGRMKCPYGCGPKKPLTEIQAHALTRKYIKLINQEGKN
jgi:uncharacterized protein